MTSTLTLTALIAVMNTAVAHGPRVDGPASSAWAACGTFYAGPPGGSIYNVRKWTNGLPREGDVVCVSEDSEDQVRQAFPAGVNVRVMPSDGSGRVPAAAAALLARRNPPPPTTMGACCVGSTCQTTDAFDCRELGGYFLEGFVECFGTPCATGACCMEDAECVDDDGMGGDMDENLCNILDGAYLGGAACEDDPCERFHIPEGFEIIDLTPGMEASYRRDPQLNNCGEIVTHIETESGGFNADVYYYDNGVLTTLTDSELDETFPDLNDHGAVVWTRYEEEPLRQSVVLKSGADVTTIASGDVWSWHINNLGHITWNMYTHAPCVLTEAQSDIYFFDGHSTHKVFADGYSNTDVPINNFDQLTWTHFTFPCGGGYGDWTSVIVFYSGGVPVVLPSGANTPQNPDISNQPRVAWESPAGLEVWADGLTTTLVEGNVSRPGLNDGVRVAYMLKVPGVAWQVWLYEPPAHFPLTTTPSLHSGGPDLNESGEIAWWWHVALTPSGTRYMRRTRNGDVDFDGDRDIEDFARFPGCWTGPGARDGLCECRFLDIDHDRDIDDDDLSLFLRVYTGPLDDCNGNEIPDLRDLVDGTCRDCNLNGIPDECDVSAGYSQDLDGDGMPDECCSAAPPQTDTLGPKNRYLTFVPENVALTAFAPPGGMGKDDGGQCPPYVDTSPLNKGGLRGVVGPEEGSAVRSTSTNDDGGQCPPYASGLRGVDRPFVKHGPRGRLTTGQLQALRVTFIDLPAPYDALNGTFMWVGEPKEVCENSGQGDDVPLDSCGRAPGQVLRTMWTATLQCEPHYTDWTQYPAPIHIEDEAIVPYGTYALQRINADCATATPANYSDPLTIRTSRWGDLVKDCTVIPCGPPDGVVNITTDVTAVLDKFKNLPGAVGKVRADLEPARVDQRINITDVVKALDAFVGFAYPFVSVPDPCPP